MRKAPVSKYSDQLLASGIDRCLSRPIYAGSPPNEMRQYCAPRAQKEEHGPAAPDSGGR